MLPTKANTEHREKDTGTSDVKNRPIIVTVGGRLKFQHLVPEQCRLSGPVPRQQPNQRPLHESLLRSP
jgi:hypothetical protein